VASCSTRSRLTVAMTAVGAAIVITGCATAPSAGAPQRAYGRNNQVQAYTVPLPPPPPSSSWSAEDVVLAFLHASATYDLDPAAARQYLTPQAAKTWQPLSVTVVSAPQASEFKTLPHQPEVPLSGQPSQAETVTFTGDRLATLSESGQYQSSSGSAVYTFTLANEKGVWLIDVLPPHVWLLLEPDFDQVYQPRNLFFFTPVAEPSAANGELVPDPVFAPLQVADSALNTSLATGLVEGLLNDRSSWLSGATWTAFPRGTYLIGGQVTINGSVAEVDLGGAAAHAPAIAVDEMLEQLQATLSNTAYSTTPVATSVQLEINGHPQYSGVIPRNLVPEVANAASGSQRALPFLVQTGPSSVSALVSSSIRPLIGPADVGRAPVTAVAAAAGYGPGTEPVAVAVQAGRGCAVYVSSGQRHSRLRGYHLPGSSGPCTSLSWDANGNIWAVAGQRIWVLRQQQAGLFGASASRQVVAVSGPTATTSQPGYRVLALRMAPDGVRAALLVHTPSGNRIMLTAVSYQSNSVSLGAAVNVGTGLPDPVAVSWYDAYHLAVLADGGIYVVPLTGDSGSELGTAPDGSVSLTTDGSQLVVGTDTGQILTASSSANSWTYVATGSDPIYPG